MKHGLFLLAFFILHGSIFAQTNVALLHQLVDQSKSENDRQKQVRDKQAVTSANEELNRSQMARLKSNYRELQSRFKVLGLAIDATQIGIQSAPIIGEIMDQQHQIISLASDDPVLIALALDVEADLLGQSHLLSNYLYGLAVSMGDFNQMKSSDRKILFGHVLVELRRINGASRGLAQSFLSASKKKRLNRLNPFGKYVQEDKRLVDNILRQISILKQP